jgi:hypothetical protein
MRRFTAVCAYLGLLLLPSIAFGQVTITVTGETPIVDVQSVRRQTTIDGDVITAIPSARAYGAIMQLIPSLTVQASFTPVARDVRTARGCSRCWC